MQHEREYHWDPDAADAVAERGWSTVLIREALRSAADTVTNSMGPDAMGAFTRYAGSDTGVISLMCERMAPGVDSWLIRWVIPTRGEDLAEYERRTR